MIVDDSALYRQSLRNLLREMPDVEIVGSAKDGVDALDKIEKLDPDLLTLDVQMPEMDGLELLKELKRRKLRSKSIMVSSLTSQGAEATTEALMEGAFDFILKPFGGNSEKNRHDLQCQLTSKINAFRQSIGQSPVSATGSAERPIPQGHGVAEATPQAAAACQAVVLGASTGGPSALKKVLPRLPDRLSVPVFVAQHMPPQYTKSLAVRLNDVSVLQVVEAEEGMIAKPGIVVLGAGGQQMRVVKQGNSFQVQLTDDPPENGVRPAVDYLLRSVTQATNGNALAVIMTGMGRDGLESCRQLKQQGGHVMAQNQADCVVYGMPKAVVEAGLAERILPLGKIAPAIVRHIKRSQRS